MPKPKIAPSPPVDPETRRALLAVAAEFATLEPWEFASDAECVGLIDPVSGEKRIGHVLGNAGEVFAAVFYRRAGMRWVLSMFSNEPDLGDFNLADGMDCLKLEFVPKRELWKEDMAVLKQVGFQPAGKGVVWPQFRSSIPGWHPWFINQQEAEQMLVDLPRLTAFCKLFEQNPELFDDRDPTEIPFLPTQIPDRLLTPDDLNWQPLILPPQTGFDPFQATTKQLEQLRRLPRQPGLECEFDCTLLPGGSFYENGRPCFGRFSLLVEKRCGLVIGMDVVSGGLAPGEAAGQTLIKVLLMAKALPEKIHIGGSRLQPVLQPLCDELQIQLWPASSLPALDEAVNSLSQQMGGRGLM